MMSETISHYRILRKLGAGGMGEVYLARDTRLDRKVAIKFLPPEAVADERARKRLLREAQAAAALDHPNICAIHEAGEEAGHAFIVMQYVEGETLAGRIARKPLELQEVLDLAVQVADALAQAHAHGIIHRDIKPQNIMLTARLQVKVLDFGLAQTLRAGALLDGKAETESLLTAPGVMVGTVPYMSPEQVRDEELDARSDIFSFGAVLYEMLSGRQPFHAGSTAATISAILTTDPVPLARFAPDLPDELLRIVRKCLEKDLEQRYQTMRDVTTDLENLRRDSGARVAEASSENAEGVAVAKGRKLSKAFASRRRLVLTALLVASVLAVIAYSLLSERSSVLPHPEIKSLAVLPLKSLSKQADDDYLGLGIANAIILKVSQIGELTVRPTSAVLKYANNDLDALGAAQQLKVDAVLDGTYQRAGDRLQVGVNLLRVKDGASLWADNFDVGSSDIFAIQAAVSQQVAARLRFRLTPNQTAELAKRYTSSFEAFEYYVKGMRSFDRRGNTVHAGREVDLAIDMLQRATAIDPNYALAYAQLAYCYTWKALFVEANPALIGHAERAMRQAERLDPKLAELHLVRAEILWSAYGGFRIEDSIREFRLAQQLNPSVAHVELGIFYAHLGLEKPALRELNRALEIDPTSQTNQSRLVEGSMLLGKYDAAIAAYDRHNRPNDSRVALAYLWTQRWDEAQQAIDQTLAQNPLDPFARSTRALRWALQGKIHEAEAEIPAIIEQARNSRGFHHDAYNIASIHALGGKGELTAEWLKKTAETGMPNYPLFARDPHLDRIRKEPAFIQLMTELKTRWEGYQREFGEGTMP
jgi:serine/threonine protein kinase/Tfp pilus assembly protein PilF